MNKIKARLDKVVQEHPMGAVLAVTAVGYTLGTLAGHYLAKGLVKAATPRGIF